MKFFLTTCLVLGIAVLGVSAPGVTAPVTYTASLDGPSEDPPNASPGTGFATVILDVDANTLQVSVNFTGLNGNTTAAHIHGPTAVAGAGNAGVMTTTPYFPGFPLGVTSGAYSNTFDTEVASTWNPAFITASGGTPEFAEAAFAGYLAAGRTYFNIHTDLFLPGEIRGFLVPPVPVPATLLLLGTGLAALAGIGTRSRQER